MRMYANALKYRYIVMSYQNNRNNPARLRHPTGMAVEHFDTLLPYLQEAHDGYFRYHQLDRRPRKGIRQEAMADLFGMEQGNCNRWIHALYGIPRNALTEARLVPASTEKDLESLYGRMDDADLSILLHDGTEREVPRPSDSEAQTDLYSGKKKRHTVKNGVIATFPGAIIFVSATVSGRIHDKTIAEGYFFPENSMAMQDTGYQGYHGDYVSCRVCHS